MNDFIAIDFETAVYNPNSAISIGLVVSKEQRKRPVLTLLIAHCSLFKGLFQIGDNIVDMFGSDGKPYGILLYPLIQKLVTGKL